MGQRWSILLIDSESSKGQIFFLSTVQYFDLATKGVVCLFDKFCVYCIYTVYIQWKLSAPVNACSGTEWEIMLCRGVPAWRNPRESCQEPATLTREVDGVWAGPRP